jgi:hypothetical protein
MEYYEKINQNEKIINDEVKPGEVREILDRFTSTANKIKTHIEKRRTREAIIGFVCCPCLTCCKCLDWCVDTVFGRESE